MSNLLDSVDVHALESVTGGGAPRSAPDPVLQQLTMLQSQLRNLSCGRKSNGFSMTQALMLGLMMSRGGVNVFVRHPYW